MTPKRKLAIEAVTILVEESKRSFEVKRNPQQEAEVLEWIEAVLETKLPKKAYEEVLKDGVVLCQLMNKIVPGSIKKIQERGTNFQLMENVQRFQVAVKKYGVPEEEIFQTADLFERRNIAQVTLGILALARIVSSLHGSLGIDDFGLGPIFHNAPSQQSRTWHLVKNLNLIRSLF
eukprot:maker-scaffold776_size99073-snap-gene-0.19 protein:Tk00561 transcript:maker-scaffold776_size99073-snap-gene-0.19-mRNA-1 annotation:"calponin transgelin"